MRRARSFLAATTTATAVLAALPPMSAAAQAPGVGNDVVTPVIWTIVAALVGVVILGIFYLLKRQLGLFENPDWIAPIEPVYSKDLPDEDEEHGAGGDAHGH